MRQARAARPCPAARSILECRIFAVSQRKKFKKTCVKCQLAAKMQTLGRMSPEDVSKEVDWQHGGREHAFQGRCVGFTLGRRSFGHFNTAISGEDVFLLAPECRVVPLSTCECQVRGKK